MTDTEQPPFIAIALVLLALLAVFLPVVAAYIRSRGTLVFCAVLFTLISCAGAIGAMVFMSGAGMFGGLLSITIFSGIIQSSWIVALLFGLAAAVDGMAEKRETDKRQSLPRVSPPRSAPPRLDPQPRRADF